ncbi:hypothetical protein AAG570_008494 [Ranatra chinensis]|uniref:Uncharacterized protein n=1 Tax=Ranatra chinensis TaxID=642074 RepID=A0ABD0YRC8_9HEMI
MQIVDLEGLHIWLSPKDDVLPLCCARRTFFDSIFSGQHWRMGFNVPHLVIGQSLSQISVTITWRLPAEASGCQRSMSGERSDAVFNSQSSVHVEKERIIAVPYVFSTCENQFHLMVMWVGTIHESCWRSRNTSGQSQKGGHLHVPISVVSCFLMAAKRRNMPYQNKKQETTEIETCRGGHPRGICLTIISFPAEFKRSP